ncbi:helix-turn-helix transcriptional regulator [Streptomyces uncialis]|uniref:helix-turn-helix transcriptional regulator n=1 Tax=Streptomyces uncialis TaxID=1048205 RepID=UPI00224FDD78|nr:YafY family protein [Streptomyces uncialis]MCX4657859.1 YafY family transcriptional regulator [Streptomyces uncialis]WTE15170.1 YafY family transcriptional regulator [Streptomyces uncialis]
MLETSARLLRLLGLMQSHRDWPGAQLAERLGVSARTVRRDVDKLRSLGYPIHAIGGVGGGYQLAAGKALPPLLLDDEEAVAVAVGLRTAAGGAVTGIAETSVRALAKLDQVLPSRLRHQVGSLSAALVTLPSPGPTVDPSILVTLATAVRDHTRLRFDYVSHEGSDSVRDVEPYRLLHTGRRWYLFGWDTGRADWRTFRTDRLTLRTPAGPRFTPRPLPAEDLSHYLALGITTQPHRYQAVLTMHGSAEAVADEVPPTLGVIEPVDEHTCVLRVGSDSLDQLAVWTAAFGFDFDIHEPPELITHIRALTQRLGRAAWPDGPVSPAGSPRDPGRTTGGPAAGARSRTRPGAAGS